MADAIIVRTAGESKMRLKIILPMFLMTGTASCTDAVEAQNPPATAHEDALVPASDQIEGSEEPSGDIELQSPVGLD